MMVRRENTDASSVNENSVGDNVGLVAVTSKSVSAVRNCGFRWIDKSVLSLLAIDVTSPLACTPRMIFKDVGATETGPGKMVIVAVRKSINSAGNGSTVPNGTNPSAMTGSNRRLGVEGESRPSASKANEAMTSE